MNKKIQKSVLIVPSGIANVSNSNVLREPLKTLAKEKKI